MIAKIIAVLVSITSVLPAPMPQLFSEMELKYELSQGNYESPYIVKPLEDVTINGVSIDNYTVVTPDGAIYSNAAETLSNEIFKACGKKIDAVKNTDKAAFIINEALNSSDSFQIRVEDGNVYITGGTAGISRGWAVGAASPLVQADASEVRT